MANLKVLPKKYEILDVNDNCVFRINIDVLNEAFGVGRAMYARAVYPDKNNTFFSGINPNDRYFIWMPKLYGNSSEWRNSISSDGKTIYEIAEPTKNDDWVDNSYLLSHNRIVFVKDSPKSPYRFVGVFRDESIQKMRHSYMRIATKIKLIGNPVFKIEILE